MGNFRRQHAKKSKRKNKKKSLQREEEEENRRVEDEQMAGDQAGGEAVVDDVRDQERENKMEKMVLLLCKDGVELVVPKEEASRYGSTIEMNISYDDYSNAYGRNISIRNRGYSLISLSVESDILSIVIHYSNKKRQDPGWDAVEFVGGLDHPTLFALILGAKHLENPGLLGVACRAVADMIDGKSQRQIRAMFGIRPPPPAAGLSTLQQVLLKKTTPDDHTMTMSELELEKRALRALHIVRCQDFTAYDPKRRAFWHSRFCDYNIAFFDLDKESRFGRGPPLHRMRESSIASSSVNLISFKVRESDVGFPINVFGTIIARDMIDYRCVYLFNRAADDSQVITSPDDMVTLMDPHRGLVSEDIIYFEINLSITCGGGATKDFSRGLTDFNICRLREQTMTISLTSWQSRVELEISHVPRPLEASITINVLKEPCELTRVAAWTSGKAESRIILYGSETSTETQMTKAGYSIALARRVVFVPLGEKLVLHVVGHDEEEPLVLTLGHCEDEGHRVCKMGCSELQVKVSWTAIPKRETNDWREVVGNVWLLK
ncbi:hypothetical protein ACQ4PT_046149 [Festuca glaucescens]